jgi:hypothetical protein
MLTQAMVTCTIIAALFPALMTIGIIPAQTMAKHNNFQKAEMLATGFMTAAVSKNALPDEVPEGCELTTDNALTFNYTIGCEFGHTRVVRASAARSFSLLSPNASSAIQTGLGIYSDDDLDGFDDITGLMTHYAECYSGWKGVSSGSLKNNCDLGGAYVIPAYAHFYE